MPFNHFFFHGAFRTLHPVAWTAFGIKLACVAGMIVIMGKIFFSLNPRLRDLFVHFAPGRTPNPEEEREFFAKRAERKRLCEICLKFAVGVLIASAFLGFGA